MSKINEAELRKELVLAAERAIDEKFKRDPAGKNKSWKLEKSQLNQLIGVCGEALCVEEIENYLRYQCSRERAPWGRELADLVLENLKGATVSLADQEKLQAWRYYAVFLAREFTYQNAKRAEDKAKSNDER